MRYTILIFLITYSHLSIANCEFSGKVYPEERQQEVEEIYNSTCKWFADTFEVSYDPSIVLNSVSYLMSLDRAESLKGKDGYRIASRFFGHFENPLEKEVNDIFVETYIGNVLQEEDKFLKKSVLFHELVHFFTKKSSFEIMKEVKLNVAMHEVIAFWSQNQYLQVNTGHTLMDYMGDKKEEYKFSDVFTSMAEDFLTNNPEAFLSQAIHFLNEDRIVKFKKIINGEYKNKSFSLRPTIENI